jgi:hypothetical protein
MSLEKIVRPAQSPDFAPVKTAVKTRTSANWIPVVNTWGIGGSLKTVPGSYSLNMSLYAVKKPKEQQAAGSFLGISFP